MCIIHTSCLGRRLATRLLGGVLASRRDGGRTNGRSSIKPCARYRDGPRRKRRQGSVRIDASKKAARARDPLSTGLCDALCRHPTTFGADPVKCESCARREARYTTYRYGAAVCESAVCEGECGTTVHVGIGRMTLIPPSHHLHMFMDRR